MSRQTGCGVSFWGRLLLLGVWIQAGTALATTMWWDASPSAGLTNLYGTGIWSTVDAYWATNSNPIAGDGPYVWVNGCDASFNVSVTAVVNSVTANSIIVNASPVRIFPGSGPLTLGAGGMNLDYRSLSIECPIILSADQSWSLFNSSYQIINGQINGPSRLTIRQGSSVFGNGTFTITNANNAFNTFTVYTQPGGYPNPCQIASGTVTNGLTLGVPGSSLTNGANLDIRSFQSVTSSVGDVTLASPALLSLSIQTAGTTNILAGGNLIRLPHTTLDLAEVSGGNNQLTFTNGIVTNNNLVAPWIVDSTYGGRYYTYAPPTGFVWTTGRSLAAFDAAAATQFVACSTKIKLGATAAAQALYTAGYGVDLAGNTLAIGDGTNAGLMLSGVISNSVPGSGTLDFGSAETYLYVIGGGTGTNMARISGTNGLVKFGGGALYLMMDQQYGGPVWIHNGALYFSPTADAIYSNNITAIGSFIKGGTNTLTLAGVNRWPFACSGMSTPIQGGQLVLSGGASSNTAPSQSGPLTTFGAPNCQLTVSNGAFFAQHAPKYVQTNCTILVTGSNTVWNMLGHGANSENMSVDANGSRFIVADGATVTNCTGFSTVANTTNSSLSVTGGGQFFSDSGSFYGFGVGHQIYIAGASAAGRPALWYFNGAYSLGDGNGTPSVLSQTMTIGGGGGYQGNLSLGARSGMGNRLIVTNGGWAKISSLVFGGASNTVWIGGTDPITGAQALLASGTARMDASSNSVTVAAGGIFSNTTLYVCGQYLGTSYNTLTVTNGSLLYGSGGVGYGGNQAGNAVGDQVTVTGAGSLWSGLGSANTLYVGNRTGWAAPGYAGGATALWNTVLIDSGAVLTNIGTISVGVANATPPACPAFSNQLAISRNGAVYASTITVGTVATNGANTVTVTSGGLLEANTLTISTAGNWITNNGGVYQFTSVTPTITPNGSGNISLVDGTLSFRAVNNANVAANVAGTVFTNIAWSGNTGFRLTAASNTTASSQTYVFEPGISPTNYARLELVGGSTCYRGQSTNALTIGQNPGSAASMLCSNTAAVVAIPFTNNGTLRIVNSSLTFTTNAALNGTVVVDLNRLANTGTVLIAQRDLSISNATLSFVGTPTNGMTLMTYTGTRSGRFQVTGLPSTYAVAYGDAQNGVISLKQTPPGTIILVK